ncbi:hypothetical protein [Paraburkholderia caribensis]|uniref:hypothetical protein n=1 Tax=Paraburkholderia caribensis TaxID=75105 RepID=UPI0031E35D2F
MKVIKKFLVAGLLLPLIAFAQSYPSPTFNNLTVQGTFTATGKVGLGSLATQAANTAVANVTGSTASPTAVALPSCSATGNALGYTSGTGFTCFTGYAPLASPTFTGTTTVSNLTVNGTLTGAAIPGRLIGVQVFTAGGTYTPTAGTNSVIVEVQAASGGSGGVAATGAGQMGASPGAGSGAYAKVRYTSGFSGVAVTIGAVGAAGAAGGNGGNAAATTFGALISCPGGIGSNAGTAVSTGTTGLIAGATPTAAPTISGGTTLISLAGGGTPYSAQIGGAAIFTAGANSILGLGGVLQTGSVTTAAVSGSGYGAGASGAVNGASASAAVGKAGQPAIVIVYEFS